MLTVPLYTYKPGKGAPICDGATIVAEVKGTSYPIGSACEADYALARVMAAGPDMLAVLKLFTTGGHDVAYPECVERARRVVATAEGRECATCGKPGCGAECLG